MEISEFQVWLTQHLTTRYRPFAGALVTYAIAPSDRHGLRVITCRWFFSDEEIPARGLREYPQILLGEEWHAGEDSVKKLIASLQGAHSLGPVLLPEFTYTGDLVRTTRAGSHSGWPEVTLPIELKSHASVPWSPIAVKGLRPYASGRQAIAEWVWYRNVPPNPFGDIPHLGSILVVLPDTRARIQSAEWEGNTLTIEADLQVPEEELEMQVAISYPDRSLALQAPALASSTVWTLPSDAANVDVFMVHLDGTLLSHLQLTRGEHYRAHAGQLTTTERAEAELRLGEGDQIEYKPFIDIADQKEWEIVETIVAFSNSGGGRLYVGVTDAGIPQDEAQLRKAGRGDVETSLATVTERLHSLVRERIKPVPRLHIEAIRILGSPIIVVDVPVGAERPYGD
jgi:hypothetical protein